MEDIKNTNKTQCAVVTINSRDYDKLLEELNKIPLTYTEKTGVFIVNHNSISEKIETIKRQFETEIYELKNYKGIPRDEIERSLQIIESLSDKIENTKTILSRYIPYLKKIKIAIDHYENEKKKDQLLFSLPSSQKTFHIFGWIPENCTTKSEELFKQYDVLYVKFSDPQKGENVPVDYKNPKTVGFYQLITDMYGRPNYTELDPTIFISLFFTFFFGFCITDAGYGLVITLITGIILLNKKIRKFIGNGISMIYIFFFSGIATIIMGAITGGFFGIPLPEVIARVVPINLAVDNLDKSAIPFLKFAIYLGAFQVGLGFVLNMIKEIKRKNTFYGIMQNLPNVLIIFSGIKIAALIMGSKVNGTLWGSIFLGSMVLNILFSAPEQKGVGRFFMGFYNTFFGFTGMLGDILSYMRLFALGLATGILIFVINTIAGVLVDLLHTPGYILAVIVLIFGHIANILLNALGAFVHSLRLQYVEFFQKFYESGGEKYQPLRNEYKFVIVDNERDIKER
jgi:V/A-type H+-transporting ATPase subunit I